MKNKFIPYTLMLFTLILNSCQSDESKINQYLKNASEAENRDIYYENEAIEFNDAIVGLQTKIMMLVLEIANKENISEMRSLIEEMRIEIDESIEILNRISSIEDKNNEFKNTSIKIFEFYKKSLLEDYSLMIDKLEIIISKDIEMDEISKQNAMEEMNEIVNKITTEEAEMDKLFQEAQAKFAENNNFLIESTHPLQDEVNNMNNQ